MPSSPRLTPVLALKAHVPEQKIRDLVAGKDGVETMKMKEIIEKAAQEGSHVKRPLAAPSW